MSDDAPPDGDGGTQADTSPDPTADDEKPPRKSTADESGGPITWIRTTSNPIVVLLREFASSALIVAVIGAVLFAIAGVWPPMVAVESGSMNPNMQKGDLIFVTEPGRFPAAFADDTGIVTTRVGEENDHIQFGKAGSVVVYRPPGRIGPPIIHRARFHVSEGENWVEKADPSALPADSCERLPNCPAPNAGYFTKGDNNRMYDQVNSIRSPPVRADWITGVARVRIPLLGWIRLIFSGAATTQPTPPGVQSALIDSATAANGSAGQPTATAGPRPARDAGFSA